MQKLTAKSSQKKYIVLPINLLCEVMKISKVLYSLVIFTLGMFISSFAQSNIIGIIDFYGNHKISAHLLRQNILVEEGDTLTDTFSEKNIILNLKAIPGVHNANITRVCCDEKEGKSILYVGISESDSFDIKFRNPPSAHIFLSKQMTNDYNEFMNQVMEAVQKNDGGEDRSTGYSLMHYAPARVIQERFITYATTQLILLEKVLKSGSNANERAVAAFIMAYSANKKKITRDLLYSVEDADEEVRNNATRAIGIIAAYANEYPEKNIKIPAELFIKMINSVTWTDRNKGIFVLLSLTEKRNPELLKKIKGQAFNSLIEMAKWKNRSHALMSFIILGRLAGMKENEIFENWNTIHSSKQIDELFMKKTSQ